MKQQMEMHPNLRVSGVQDKKAAEKAQEHQGHHVPSLRYRLEFGEQSLCKVKMSAVCFLRKGMFINNTHTQTQSLTISLSMN